MIKRRLGFAGILLAGLILVLYLTGGGKIFGRLGVSRCEKLWKESEEVMVEGEVYQKTRKEEKLILYLKKIQIREMGNGKAVADERMLVYLDEKGNGPEIGQRILVKGNVGFFDPAANPGNFDQKNYYKQQNIQAVLWKGKVLEKQVKKTSLREKLWQFRNRTADEICREMGKRRGGILCAVLLGDSFYTEEKVKELYRVAGIGHLLAISGLHISFLGNGLYRGLRKTGFSILPEKMILPEFSDKGSALTTISGNLYSVGGTCKDLRELVVPQSYISIMNNTLFQNCSKLETIYLYNSKLSTISKAAIWTNCNALKNIYVPAEALSAYQKSTFWKAKLDCLKPLP